MGGRTGCAESEGLCDLPFSSHSYSDALERVFGDVCDRDFVLVNRTVSRHSVGLGTGNEMTLSHHCHYKKRRNRIRKILVSTIQHDQFLLCETSKDTPN